MKRRFLARLLLVVSAWMVLSLFAPPRCDSFPKTRIVSVSAAMEGREKKGDVVTFFRDADQIPDPEVYIHIRSDRQQAAANRIREKLTRDGYLVPRIIMVSFGPHENQVRYFHDDGARARSVAHELRTIGFTPISVQRIGHYETNPPGRYELWLAPHAR